MSLSLILDDPHWTEAVLGPSHIRPAVDAGKSVWICSGAPDKRWGCSGCSLIKRKAGF